MTLIHTTLTYTESDFGTTPFTTEQPIAAGGFEGQIFVLTSQGKGLQGQPKVTAEEGEGLQGQPFIEANEGKGLQGQLVFVGGAAFQGRIVLYNTKLTRVMCEFPTRGITSDNWSGTASAPGDFGLENLDNDIPESVYRTDGQTTGVVITTDCGAGQSVSTDTIAILNHNLTRDAFVRVLGSNDPGFGAPNFDIVMQVTTQNMYWIAEFLPATGSRYFRYQIDDPGNPDGFIQIGIIVHGPTDIFQNECTVDQIPFTLQDFSDSVQTEGFSNVENSRSLKRSVSLEFRLLDGAGRGFGILRNIFQTYRTTHKCLWIPTPDVDDQNVTGRFAVFGKITELPTEQHNWKDTKSFVDVTFTVDEAK